MNTILELIEKLKNNACVIGLIEYGNANYEVDEIAGDYDIVVILTQCDPDVESIHFYIGETPVDLNLRTLEDIRSLECCEGFDAILLEGRIIHDHVGSVEKEIQALRKKHGAANPPHFPEAKIGALRHGPRHTLDKLRSGRYKDTPLCRYLLHQCVHWALPQYFEVRNLSYQGERKAFAYLQDNAPDLYAEFESFYAGNNFENQLQTMQDIVQQVLEPIGGIWKDKEVLTFGNSEKGREVFKQLVGK